MVWAVTGVAPLLLRYPDVVLAKARTHNHEFIERMNGSQSSQKRLPVVMGPGSALRLSGTTAYLGMQSIQLSYV